MRLYDRSSRTVAYADLDETVRTAVDRQARERLLGDVTPVACVETRSVSLQRPGWLGRLAGRTGEAEHRTVAVLTGQALIVVTTGAERGVLAMSTRLDDITAINQQDPEHVIDPGIMVESRWGGAETGSYYVGLGDDVDGRGFHETLRGAVLARRETDLPRESD